LLCDSNYLVFGELSACHRFHLAPAPMRFVDELHGISAWRTHKPQTLSYQSCKRAKG